jgi:uncharacterized protein YutE (UPF0331/DUF86 family)
VNNEDNKKYVRIDRIKEYMENIQRQLDDLRPYQSKDKKFFLNRKNIMEIKAIKFSLACAIQDISRISSHISSALNLWKVKESIAEAILALGDANIIPQEFADEIKWLPAFRNRIIHDYLPNEFDAEKLFNILQNLNIFRKFCKYIQGWLNTT